MPAWEIDRTGVISAEVQTPYGVATIKLFDGDHGSVVTGSGELGRDDTFTYDNGKEYRGRVSVHGLAGEMCEWRPQTGQAMCGKVGQHNHRGYVKMDGPPSYAAKMLAALNDAVRDFIAAHPDALTEAERLALSADLVKTSKEAASLEDQLTAKRLHEADLCRKLADLG